MMFMRLNLRIWKKNLMVKKIMYKGGVPVQNQQQEYNNINNLNKINNYGYNNNKTEDDPYGFDKMSYEQAFGIKKNK